MPNLTAHRQHKIMAAVAILRMMPYKGVTFPGGLKMMAEGVMQAALNEDVKHLVRMKRNILQVQQGVNVVVAPDAQNALSGVLQLLAP